MPALYIAYRGEPEDRRLRWSSFDGQGLSPRFSSPQILEDRGSWDGPALANLGAKLYMAWRGVEDDVRLFWATAELRENRAHWSEQHSLDDRGSTSQPALAVYQDKLFMAWRGATEDDSRLFWATFDGMNWSRSQVLDDRGSFSGPALAEFHGKLFMAWRGIEFDHRIFWATFDGTLWSPQQVLDDRGSQDGPALCVFRDNLYMFLRGPREDRKLFFSTLDESSSGLWSGPRILEPLMSEARPAVAVFRNQLYIANIGVLADADPDIPHKEDGVDHPPSLGVFDTRLRYAIFDGERPTVAEQAVGDVSRASPALAVFPDITRSLRRFLLTHGFDPSKGVMQVGGGSVKELMGL